MTDGMFCAQYLSQYQEILSKMRLFGTRNCSKLGRSLYLTKCSPAHRAMQYKRKRYSKWEPTPVRCNFTIFKVYNIEIRSNLLPNNLCKLTDQLNVQRRTRAYCACSRCRRNLFSIPRLLETVRYRLKYCFKVLVNQLIKSSQLSTASCQCG